MHSRDAYCTKIFAQSFGIYTAHRKPPKEKKEKNNNKLLQQNQLILESVQQFSLGKSQNIQTGKHVRIC